MATIAEVKTKIESANALGIANLTEKGVEIGANATTYEIMKNIAEVAGGGGQYKSVTYNGDNTVALVDKQGVYHVIECEYTNNKLTGVTYDGSPIELTYDGTTLVKIGRTDVNIANAPYAPSGEAELNIAYGETPPEDTSKLWIKANEPENIKVSNDIGSLITYIESTGTQAINTGVYPHKTEIYLKAQCVRLVNAGSSSMNFLAGCYNSSNQRYYAVKSENSNELSASNKSNQQITLASNGDIYNVFEVVYNNDNNEVLFNGQVKGTVSDLSYKVDHAIGLFAQITTTGGVNPSYEHKGAYRLYACKIRDKETNTLLRDFVPAVDSNDVICLYDKVTNTFFYNQGSGEFLSDGVGFNRELIQGNIEIKTTNSEVNNFNLINTNNTQVEIGVENVYIGNENNEAELVDAYLHNGTEWVQI